MMRSNPLFLLIGLALSVTGSPSPATCPEKKFNIVTGTGQDMPFSSLPIKPILWVGPECLNVFTGSPAILRVGSEWFFTHDFFGTTSFNRSKQLYVSRDEGRSWSLRATVSGMYWSNLFKGRNGSVYMHGVNGDDNHVITPPNTKALKGGPVVIAKSSDGGYTWTIPSVVLQGSFQTAPTPSIMVNGTIFRSMEESTVTKERHAVGVGAFIMWAPADADLLHASSWHRSSSIAAPRGPNNETLGWQEGSVVESPSGEVWNILRVNGQTVNFYNKACHSPSDLFLEQHDLPLEHSPYTPTSILLNLNQHAPYNRQRRPCLTSPQAT